MPTGYPGTKAAHGTVTRYINSGCRCEPCRDAHRVYYGRRPREAFLAEIEVPHGTASRYKRCHCDLCRTAASAARRAYRERNKIPCSHGCGTLVLHERRDPLKPPECKPCSLRRIHTERAA